MNSLLSLRRQFILSPSVVTGLTEHFSAEKFGDHHLYTHKELKTHSVDNDDNTYSIILVGFIINPGKIEKSDREIISELIEDKPSIDDFSKKLNNLTGRFVIFLKIKDKSYVFNDPCGLRSVNYKNNDGEIYIGSSTEIIKLACNIKKGKNHSSYIESSYMERDLEHWIPSGLSLYDDVEHLVPNHYLEFNAASQKRYWPNRELESMDAKKAAQKSAKLIENSIISASKRFKIAIPMTAGWDSRLILALSKEISKDAYFYTLKYRSLDESSDDISIPKKLLNKLNLSHNILSCDQPPTEEFKVIYENNSVPSHFNDWGKIAYGILSNYPKELVCLKGNCSEIARCFYYPSGEHKPIRNYEDILSLEPEWEKIPFIREKIKNWFSEASEISSKYKIDILDLFYWEHRMGSWQAQSQLEWDIAQEAFTPYNNRELLEIMLSTSTKLRNRPNFSFYKMIIELKWPETLKMPINPPDMKTRIKDILIKVGLFDFIKSIAKR